MAKASIFSKDYEKVMKRRKRRIRVTCFFSLLIVVLVSIKIINYDFSDIEHRLQLWVKKDSNNVDSIVETEQKEEQNIEVEKNPGLEENKVEEITEEKVAIVINNINLNLILKNQQGVKSIIDIENRPDNYYYSLSKNRQSALIIDELQNINLIKSTGEITNLTLSKYVAPNGEIFEKNTTITNYSGYLWHSNAKILGDNKVVYISNVPYFGYDLDKYVTIIDLNDKSHKTIWSMKGKNIIFGEFDGNRLEVTIDGNIRYINANGEETS